MIINFILISLFLPLFFGLIIFFVGNKIGIWYFMYIYIFTFIISFLTIFISFISFIKYNFFVYINFFNLINFDNFIINFDFLFDSLTIVMFFVVVMISFFVTLFAFWYMLNDPNIFKFFLYLNFFCFFMLILVSANNIILIFIGWEGIGIFSYFLINFWTTRLSANRSALKAIIVNKIGDCFFYLFMIFYFFTFETFSIIDSKLFILNYKNFENIFSNQDFVSFMLMCLVLACMAKSAQVFLHVWLPDAMEGPTPVSALLHAATMVTAGIYILIKFNWLFFCNLNIFSVVLFIGFFTNIFASLTAIFQYDIKKIIAYSTASQLGLIFMSFGILKFNYALFHIFNHAFFKALLFILSGILIHNFNNFQDLRNFLFIKSNLFWLYFFFLIATLTLTGFPFLSAYYSKEFIIQYSFFNIYIGKNVFFFFLNISVITTLIYTLKIFNFIFSKKNFIFFFKNNSNSFSYINLLTFVLSSISIFIGYMTFFYFNSDFLKFSSNFFYYLNLENNNSILDFDYSIFFILSLMFITFFDLNLEKFVTKYNLMYNKNFKNFFFFLNKKWFFDNLYYYIINFFFFNLNIFSPILDRKFIEYKALFIYTDMYKLIAKFCNSFFLTKILFFCLIWLLTSMFFFLFSPLFLIVFIFLILQKSNAKQ